MILLNQPEPQDLIILGLPTSNSRELAFVDFTDDEDSYLLTHNHLKISWIDVQGCFNILTVPELTDLLEELDEEDLDTFYPIYLPNFVGNIELVLNSDGNIVHDVEVNIPLRENYSSEDDVIVNINSTGEVIVVESLNELLLKFNA